MNLLSVLHDEETNTVEATWTDDDGNRVRCHIYSDRQMADLRTDLGKNSAEYGELIAIVEANMKPLHEVSPEQRKAEQIALEIAELRGDVKFQNLITKTPQQAKNWVDNSFPTLTLLERRDLATIVQTIGILGQRL